MAQKTPLIKIEDVWKIYELGKIDLTVLKGVNLEIFAGKFVVILGPSGSGKSTLLNIIGLLDVPSKGKVLLKGQDTSNFSEDELAEIRGREIGFVFQQFNLLPHLTALQNVMVPLLFQGASESQRREQAKSLLKSVGLNHRENHRPPEMSGGEQQRIAIARALANNPKLIVADEPTGNLDSNTGNMIMDILIDLHKKEKRTIIAVTHDPNIASYGEEIINIKDGEVVKDGAKRKEIVWEKKNQLH